MGKGELTTWREIEKEGERNLRERERERERRREKEREREREIERVRWSRCADGGGRHAELQGDWGFGAQRPRAMCPSLMCPSLMLN